MVIGLVDKWNNLYCGCAGIVTPVFVGRQKNSVAVKHFLMEREFGGLTFDNEIFA